MIKPFLISLALILSFGANATAEGVIIVNKKNPIKTISINVLKKIYNGNTTLWNDRTKIIPVELDESHPMAIRFTEVVQGVNMETKRRFWVQKMYAGSGSPPKEVEDEISVISIVSSEPGAIGYINKENIDGSVKVVPIDLHKNGF